MNYSPDIFEVLIKIENAKKYSIKSYETPYGLTTEKYLFHNNQVLGEYSELYDYHKSLGFEKSAYFVVSLLRRPEYSMPIDLSNITNFISTNKDLVLIFELDCDQYKLEFRSDSLSEIINDITNFFATGDLKNKAFIKII